MVFLLPLPFLQWRLTNCGKGPHITCEHCCIFIGRVSRFLHWQRVPKSHIKFIRRRITQKKEYNIQKNAEVLNQDLGNTSEESPKDHVNSSQTNSVLNKTASSALERCYEKDSN
jgi:hypothetical protein